MQLPKEGSTCLDYIGGMVKYDDASWHYGGTYPADLSDEAAATHIGMFVAWCVLNGYVDDEVAEDLAGELDGLTARTTTPGEFLIESMDEKFVSDDLTGEGDAFTNAYYQGKDNDSRYVDDYLAVFDTTVADIYRVPDTWETFDRIAPRITERYGDWVAAERPEFIA